MVQSTFVNVKNFNHPLLKEFNDAYDDKWKALVQDICTVFNNNNWSLNYLSPSIGYIGITLFNKSVAVVINLTKQEIERKQDNIPSDAAKSAMQILRSNKDLIENFKQFLLGKTQPEKTQPDE